jgi:hypothetical protein
MRREGGQIFNKVLKFPLEKAMFKQRLGVVRKGVIQKSQERAFQAASTMRD